MHYIVSTLLLAALLPFITGFVEVPPTGAGQTSGKMAETAQTSDLSGNKTILFPAGELFHPPLANPKEPRSHVTWVHLNLDANSVNVAAVGFGESFGLIRWPGESHEDGWQLGISGAVLAQFNLDAASNDLVNADYIIGFPFSYRNGPWSARARLFHQSSHLGDEFLLSPQRIVRVERINLSFETMEMLAAWELAGFQVTGGPSYILHTYTPLKRWSVQGGVDYQSEPVAWKTTRLFGSILLHSWEETSWNIDTNIKAGINIRSPYSEKRAIQFFGEYYNGNLPFGQFYKLRADYYGAGINFSF